MTDTLGFNLADIIAIIVVLIGIVIGFKQGLTSQMAMFLMALSVWAAIVNGLDPCREWFIGHFGMPRDLARIAALICLTVIPLLVVALLYMLLRFVMKITFTTWVDRIGGALAGGVTSVGIVLLAFILLNALPAEKRPKIMGDQSWISRHLAGVETNIIEKLTSEVNKGENVIEKAREARAGKRERWEQ
jgi:uncharacterized membrane protein required for colicin V production